MKNWISFPRVEGTVTRQAHADLPEGTYEREMGREGFFGPAAHLYHRHPPTGWSDWEGPLRPRAFDTAKFNDVAASPWEAKPLLANAHVKIRLWRVEGAMDHLVRNGDGDDLVFVHEGGGELYCDFGHLSFREGDYIVLPRGTMWRIEPSSPVVALLIEATNAAYKLPDKGMVGNHAVFDPAMLDVPAIDDAFKAQQTEESWRLRIKRREEVSTVTYPYNPLDAVGWKGDMAPVRINWRDIRPLMSARYHVPPSAHTTFVGERFVVCTFAPRPIESDPGALKVPFFHNNDDYDEVIFLHRGTFFSRDNFRPGMITLHPSGFPHGPHPKAFATGAKGARTETDEVAVMIDTRDALDISDEARSVEWPDYIKSWSA
jgi:homogentisate 1,2-dioxygenase